MYQLLETIKVRNNMLQNIPYHNERVNRTRKALLKTAEEWDLSQILSVPELDPETIYRCRFLYAQTVETTEFLTYKPRHIEKLYLVQADNLDYSFKYANRDALEELKSRIAQEQDADILIVRNGLITDTSFSNIAFYDGTGWETPDSPLLKGTKRAFYLHNGMLREKRITTADLPHYQKARLINAMLDLEDGRDIEIKNIVE